MLVSTMTAWQSLDIDGVGISSVVVHAKETVGGDAIICACNVRSTCSARPLIMNPSNSLPHDKIET